jgi:hypothetical protein
VKSISARVSVVLALLALSALSACKTDGGASTDSAPPPVVISAADAASSADAGDAGVSDGGIGKAPTATAWVIAGRNLDGMIADRVKKNDTNTEPRLSLIELILNRNIYTANVADLEQADEIAAGSVFGYPKDGFAHYSRALTLGAFHKFDAELKELDQAIAINKSLTNQSIVARTAVFMALGRYDDAAALMPKDSNNLRTPSSLTIAAVLAAHMQKIDESEKLFARARDAFVDVSPFPVAWMDFQHAFLLEGRGQDSLAKLYYAEALEAIPVYVHAGVHLAAMEPPEDAIKRLEALRKVSTEPDILSALADANRKLHKDDEVKALIDEAKKSYDGLIAKHPEAYRDHAARFWLGNGNDPKKALDLAEKNAALRATEEAIDLWMGAAAAANKKEAVCKSAAAMNKLTYASEGRKRLATAALSSCPGGAGDAGAPKN